MRAERHVALGTVPLKEHLDIATTVCRKIFDATGYFVPLLHTIDADGTHGIACAPEIGDPNEAVKNAIAALIRENFRKRNIVQYVLVTEAWTVTIDKPTREQLQPGNLPRPSEHPDRTEVLVFQAEAKGGQQLGARIPIITDADGNRTLGDLDVDTGIGMTFIGRMCGFLETKQ